MRIDAPAGEAGEVLVQGPNVMQGYWNKPEQTAAALQNGWYRTGDIGYLDDEGFLYLVDRAKDMIISGGENVCSEVEEVIYQNQMFLRRLYLEFLMNRVSRYMQLWCHETRVSPLRN